MRMGNGNVPQDFPATARSKAVSGAVAGKRDDRETVQLYGGGCDQEMQTNAC